jgi:diguanylate cyclase
VAIHRGADEAPGIEHCWRLMLRSAGHWFNAQLNLIIALFAVLMGFGSSATDVGRPLDLMMRDARDGLHVRKASGEVHIVEIDAKSLAAIDNWPWPRRHHAGLVDRLSAANARVIAFDVDFSSYSNPTDDAIFARALAGAEGAVILPTFQQRSGSGHKALFENLPITLFRENAFLASVNVEPNLDGQVRTYSAGVVTAQTMRPSIGAMLADQSRMSSGSMTIDQSIDPASIPRHSFVDVLSGKVPAAVLAGKRVIVGATAIELGDRYAVPRHGVLPGVVIQAMAAETMLLGTANPNFGGIPLLVLSVAILAMCVRRIARTGALVGLSAAVVLVAPLPMELAKLGSLDVAPALVSLVVGGGLMSALALFRSIRTSQLVDSETGLPNARAFSAAMAREHEYVVVGARIARFGELVSIIGGEAAADLVRRIAERLTYATDDGIIFRFAGDALVWNVPPAQTADLSDRLACLAALFRAPVGIGNRMIDVGITYGIARVTTSDAGSDPLSFAAKAMLAADRAADQGLLWDLHDNAIDTEVDWKLALLGELDSAIADNQIWVAYQPKADIKSGAIIGVEALVRWSHPTRGAIAPDHFIPTIEQAGRMLDLTLFVLRSAARDLERWRRAGHDISVAVNLSPSLLDDDNLVALVAAELAGVSFDPSALTLEITESAAMATPDHAIRVMAALRALGVQLSIDDYGTGQSTLTYLKRLPATEIKIDRSFIQDLVDSRSDQILVRSTIALAHDLGFKTVAEGVENAACMAMLGELGCDTAQGWHIGRPMPFGDLQMLLGPPLAIAA